STSRETPRSAGTTTLPSLYSFTTSTIETIEAMPLVLDPDMCACCLARASGPCSKNGRADMLKQAAKKMARSEWNGPSSIGAATRGCYAWIRVRRSLLALVGVSTLVLGDGGRPIGTGGCPMVRVQAGARFVRTTGGALQPDRRGDVRRLVAYGEAGANLLAFFEITSLGNSRALEFGVGFDLQRNDGAHVLDIDHVLVGAHDFTRQLLFSQVVSLHCLPRP